MCDQDKESKVSQEKESQESKVSDFIRKLISAGWGIWAISEEKAKNFIDEAVHRGEMSRKEAEGLLNNLKDKIQVSAKETEQKIMEAVHKYMKSCPVDKTEIEDLKARVAELERKVACMEKKEPKQSPPVEYPIEQP